MLRLGVLAGTAELVLKKVMEERMGLPGEAYAKGQPGKLGQVARAVTVAGVLTAGLAGCRGRGRVRSGPAGRVGADPVR